jgi:hypothetical protein
MNDSEIAPHFAVPIPVLLDGLVRTCRSGGKLSALMQPTGADVVELQNWKGKAE